MDKDSYEKGFQDGHKCCAYEKEKLLAENARYREALELALELAENGLVYFKKYGLNNDKDIVKKYREALGHDEPDEVYDYDGL